MLKKFRERAGLTQEAAAELIGVAPRTLIRWETGRTRVPQCASRTIQDIYNLTSEDTDVLFRKELA